MYEKKISVIVPVYNMELYLDRCLKSIINNSYKNLEIICVNDGSTDASLEILEKYKKEDSRIIIINQKNRGVSAARNTGLDIATGEYISFVDADDVIHSKFFTCLIAIMVKFDADITISGYSRNLNYEMEQDVWDITSTEILSRAQFMNIRNIKNYVWGRIYRKNIITNQFDEKSRIEDADFNAALISKNKNLKIMYMKFPLYFYFFRTGSLVSQVDGRVCSTLGERLYQYALQEKDRELKQVFGIDSIKRLLSAGYEYKLVGDFEKARNCYIFAQKNLKFIYRGKEKLKYEVLICCPQLYRAFRIMNDPTIRKWEKIQRERK